MAKNKKILLIAGVVCLLVCLGIVLAMCGFGGRDSGGNQPDIGETATYTIEVKSASGIALADVGLYIYEDSTCKELVAVLKTDENGKTAFTDVSRDTYVAVIDKVPTGYEAEDYYPITGELTQIILKTGQMTDADVETLTYKLGDAVMDFSVTGPDGTVYTLSGLFEGKKAVVLNFFYNGCQPCMMEFPFLQEAYAEYSDDIAVLALNPVDGDDASVAALQKQLGVTFPMVKCGPEWESIMQISAYPTTVIIDRFGNICLIHKGSVTDAKTFKDAFAYFAAEDYEQKLIEDIGDLAIEEPEGTKENPAEVGGQTAFEVTVEPGKVVYNDLYKVFDMYLTIRSENAYVIYNGKTYYPKNGVVSLKVSAPDTHTPASVGIGNSGTKTETFKVTLSVPAGTFNNPHKLSLGEFDVKVAAGNDQGVYYTYTPTEDGTLTLQCLSASNGVKYGYSLFNTVSSAMRNLEADSVTDASGAVTVSVQAKKGQLIQICISTLPDSSNSYPAGNFKFKATFTGHEIKEEEKIPMTAYTVTVLDDAKQPVPNVSVIVTVDGAQKAFTTDKQGVANISLPTGSYKGSFYVPDGYTAAKTEFDLTEAAPNVTLTLDTIKQANYTVKVVGPTGEAIANVLVRIGSAWKNTDAQGTVTMQLDKADYAVTIMVPAGYSGETAYAFAEGATELTITLNYPLGTQKNPYQADSYPFDTVNITKGQEIYVDFHYTEDVTGLCIYNEDAYIRYNETTYGPDEWGIVYVPLEEDGMESPVQLIIGNIGTTRTSFTVEAEYAMGTEMNPEVLMSVESVVVNIPEGSEQGYYYVWYVPNKGALTLNCPTVDGVKYDVILTEVSNGATARLSDREDGTVSMDIAADSMINLVMMQIVPAADDQGNYPALETTLTGTFIQPVGSYDNPQVITDISQIDVDIPAGEEYGYCYSWTANKTGVMALTCPAVQGVEYDVMLLNKNTLDMAWLSDTELGFVSMAVESGDVILIQVAAFADGSWNYPALKTTITGSYPEVGTLANPDTLTLDKMWQQKLSAGDADGHCFGYTAEEDGILTVQLKQKPAKPYEVRLINGLEIALMSESGVEREVTIAVRAGETVLVHFYALADETTGTYPAITGRLWAAFTPGLVEEDPSDPTDPGTEPSTDPSTDPSTEPSTEPSTAPSAPTGPAEGEYTYSVTVTDIFGAGQANVQVIFMQGGVPVSAVITDANGVAELYTDELADYSVELFFTDGRDYYYDKNAAVLTADSRSLTVKLIANVVESDYSGVGFGEITYPGYNLYVGATRVQVGSGKPNFSAEQGNNCFFVFTPQTAGTYQITTSTVGAELSAWGSTSYVYYQAPDADAEANVITKSISGTSVKNTSYVIGVKVTNGVSDVVINIARIGDPSFNIADQPWSQWETGYTHSDSCKVSADAKVTYFDIKAASGTYNLYYDEAKGYYRLYKDGPVVLVNLGQNVKPNGTFIGLYERINGNGQYGGTSLTRYFYDSTGAFIRKENYTECVVSYFECAGITTHSAVAYHPLTKDLMYALQNGYADWWDSTSPNYLEVFETANKEYAWMFACCYIP